jgi:hypothetical protein
VTLKLIYLSALLAYRYDVRYVCSASLPKQKIIFCLLCSELVFVFAKIQPARILNSIPVRIVLHDDEIKYLTRGRTEWRRALLVLYHTVRYVHYSGTNMYRKYRIQMFVVILCSHFSFCCHDSYGDT